VRQIDDTRERRWASAFATRERLSHASTGMVVVGSDSVMVQNGEASTEQTAGVDPKDYPGARDRW